MGDAAKVGFVFNHDAGHQAGHLIPILAAYAAYRPDHEVRAYAPPGAVAAAVRAAAGTGRNIRVIELSTPIAVRAAARVFDHAMPASRLFRLRFNAGLFADLDILVAPEHAILAMKRWTPPSVRFVYSGHGAGDRAYGFDAALSAFDLILAPGKKSVRRFRAAGALDGNAVAIVGYPKFDHAPDRSRRDRFFDNDNPVILYNPHFSPALSSWYRAGRTVIDWFATNPEFNLIVAPHVMLGRRPVHRSPGTGKWGWTGGIPARYRSAPNIRIDFSSPRLFDMSYTNAADLYLGDASSQVMEFLLHPRPCVFLNVRRHEWRGDENFAHWRLGPVVDDVADLGATIRSSLANPDAYRPAQQEHFANTFDLTREPSAARAARAIAALLDEERAPVVAAAAGELELTAASR